MLFGAQLLRRHSVFGTLSARAGGPGTSGRLSVRGMRNSCWRWRQSRILPTYYSMYVLSSFLVDTAIQRKEKVI